MTLDCCTECARILDGTSDDKQAVRVEEAFPHCECEKHSVGKESPGPVGPEEIIYRMVVSPASIDWNAKKLIADSFKAATLNGFSVFRDMATDADINALAIDRLSRKTTAKPKTVQALIRFKVEHVRSLGAEGVEGRLFCVYDETVPRRDPTQPRVPTHVTVLQRLPPAKVDGRTKLMKDGTLKLYNLAEADLLNVEDFRDGLFAKLNERSLAGDFVLPEH
ncbi:hypothetical protein FJ970_22560 [Mesorhizobium sp. B2-1-8]|uniref:hypothetical protein n=1 Tax=Mesorhizobium sp. B2-1-8 TaxID=2589967 RepID=UPI00112E0F93|nr:hypothetical protein [Mesorhizobium sp. B2-1-8]UCI17867.1 hypothetical protein FJ970_22560 [Mesorhizobium sp. B2-1-8]